MRPPFIPRFELIMKNEQILQGAIVGFLLLPKLLKTLIYMAFKFVSGPLKQ
jgi:hypothetical protein